ncbi:MAG: GNAT family N-acetyltransferase [Actinomycetota bacterium]
MIALRICRTDELRPADLDSMRALFDAAWPDGAYTADDWDNTTGGLHFVVELDGRLASHAAVVERELRTGRHRLRTGYVEAVATWPGLQRRGFATRAMRAANEHIAATYPLGGLDTDSPAFYERLGWELWRGPTSVRTAEGERRTPEEDGYVMILRTPGTPADLDLDAPISCEWRRGDVW